jgi:Viral BACON domain
VTLTVLPIFGVNPSDVRFTAIVSGSNPPNQTVDISGNESGIVEWMASDDAPWLSVTPTGGTAPSTLTASVDINGLAAGTYHGTITIGSTSGLSSPARVPVTLTVLPVFGVNPSGLSFTAIAGGGAPPLQNVYISNNDSNLRNWMVSDDAPWLTVSPASGAAPSRFAASVDIRGLTAGTYHGTVSIGSTDPSTQVVRVPVTLIVDWFINGGFEEMAYPWVLSGAARRSTERYAHGGAGYLILGGANSSSGSAYQQVTIPRGSPRNLSFWLNVTSDDATAMANDKLWIEVCSPSGRGLAALATFSNLDRSAPGNYRLCGKYSLARFAGQTVRIRFRTQTDASSTTSFRIDDVSLR